MDSNTIWGRRTNTGTGKLSLSTASSNHGTADSGGRKASFAQRWGGDSSSHGKTNPFNNSLTTPVLSSPTSGSNQFGLGSGAFASFGSSAKTPKSAGNPFDAVLKTPATERSAAAVAAPPSVAGNKDAGEKLARHPLRNSWVFWFRPPISKANGYIEYEKTLHPMAAVGSVEEFLAVYSHLKRPSSLPLVSDYHLFKKGVRPIWEDDENKKGGKWIVRLKKGVADRYWEDLLMAIIGDQFGEAGEEVCGVVLSVRNGEDILSIWTRTDRSTVRKIRDTMRRVLSFPSETNIEFKTHDESIQQRVAIEESRREKANNHHHHSDKRSSRHSHNQHGDDQKQGTAGAS